MTTSEHADHTPTTDDKARLFDQMRTRTQENIARQREEAVLTSEHADTANAFTHAINMTEASKAADSGLDALIDYLADLPTLAALASTPSPAQPTEASGRAGLQHAGMAAFARYVDGDASWVVPLEAHVAHLVNRAALAPSPVQGADDRLAQAEAVIAAIEAWRREPFAGNAEGGIRWTALDHIFRDYQQSPQAALNEVRAGELQEKADTSRREWLEESDKQTGAGE